MYFHEVMRFTRLRIFIYCISIPRMSMQYVCSEVCANYPSILFWQEAACPGMMQQLASLCSHLVVQRIQEKRLKLALPRGLASPARLQRPRGGS